MLRAGDVLAGRYRLENRVGGGGMGDVWLGEDVLLNRSVAVKVLLAKLAEEDGFRERFRREACAIAALESPNIVDVYDYGEVGSPRGILAFLVMPYVDARPLSRRLAHSGRLETSETLDIIAQVADGLHIAHEAGVIHRDVKPGNILVGDSGHVTLVDFGIARTSGNLTMTATGVVLGTVTYMSPEQASGERLTPASDVYSLGVVGYQCLVGNPPFKADTPLGVLSAHLRDVPPQLPDEIPDPVPDLIVRALDKDPANRWKDASEFAAACRRAAESARFRTTPVSIAALPAPQVRQPHFRAEPPGPAVGPSPETSEKAPPRPARRGVMLLGVVALVAVLLATAAAMRPWEARQLVEVTDETAGATGATDAAGITDQDGAGGGEHVDTEPSSSHPASGSPSRSPSATTESSASPSSSASSHETEPVPDVVRLSESQARRTLKGAGFRPVIDYQGDGDNTCEVVSQQPEAGHEAEPGSAVTITVSRGEVCTGG